MEKDILKVLITEEQIRQRIQELGEELTRDYRDKDPIIVGVLKGVVVFYADMIRQIKTPCQMDFMWISSYEGTQKPDYVGYTVPNEFVVGYGLDYNEHYRNLPYIGVLKPEAYGA